MSFGPDRNAARRARLQLVPCGYRPTAWEEAGAETLETLRSLRQAVDDVLEQRATVEWRIRVIRELVDELEEQRRGGPARVDHCLAGALALVRHRGRPWLF